MYGADQAAKAPTPRTPTLNERLNKTLESITFQCDRLESVLNRVNGTPTAAPTNIKEVAQIRPTHSMQSVVDHLEQAHQRLASLTDNVEQIA